MEEHFLQKYVEGEQKFRAEPWYNSYGDCLEYQTADEAVVADRIDEILTVFRSVLDNRPIGFKIKGIAAVLNKFGFDGLAIASEQNGTIVKTISIYTLLLAAYEIAPPNIKRRNAYSDVYADILTQGEANLNIPISALQAQI